MKCGRTGWILLVCAFGLSPCIVAQEPAKLSAVADQLADASPDVRMNAVRVAAEMGPDAVKPLFARLKGEGTDAELALRMAIDRIVQDSSRPGQDLARNAVADALLHEAQFNRTPSLRQWAMHELSFVAGARQIQGLRALLRDPDLWWKAHWVLQRMPATLTNDTFAAALQHADATQTVPLLVSLGAGRAVQYEETIIKYLTNENLDVRVAAIEALGRIPTPRAETVLRGVLDWESKAERQAAWKSYLLLAEQMAQMGKKKLAWEMYEIIYSSAEEDQYAAAGLRGMARVGGTRALNVLLMAVDRPEPSVRGVAVEELVRLPGKKVTRAVADRRSFRRSKRLLLDVLGQRGDRSVTPALLPAMKSRDEGIRVAALTAAGRIGDPRAIPPLIAALGSDSTDERIAAQNALNGISGPKADEMLVMACLLAFKTGDVRPKPSPDLAWLGGDTPAMLRAGLLRVAAHRRSPVVSLLVGPGLRDSAAPVRLAAIECTPSANDSALVPRLLEIAAKGNPAEVAAAHQALLAQPPALARPALMDGLKSPSPQVRAAAVRALGARQDPELLDVFLEAGADTDERVSLAGIEALAPFKSAKAAALLQRLAFTGTARQKVAATGAYLDLADATMATDAAAGDRMYQEVFDKATEAEQIARACQGVARSQKVEYVPRLLNLLESDDPAIRAQAGRALIPITEKVGIGGDVPRAMELYRLASRYCTDADMLRVAATNFHVAAKHLNKPDLRLDPAKDAGFLTDWWLLGPLPSRAALVSHDIIDTTGPIHLSAVVQVGEATYTWTHNTSSDAAGIVDLDSIYGQRDDTGAYAYRQVTSDRDRNVQLRLASDDDIVIWVNGQEVFRRMGRRGIDKRIDTDAANARLRKGKNEILVKVLDVGGAWQFVMRLADEQGRTIILE